MTLGEHSEIIDAIFVGHPHFLVFSGFFLDLLSAVNGPIALLALSKLLIILEKRTRQKSQHALVVGRIIYRQELSSISLISHTVCADTDTSSNGSRSEYSLVMGGVFK